MKVIVRIFFLFVLLGVIASCTRKTSLTNGAASLLATYNKILSKKDTCSLPHHSKIYAVNSSMPAIDYMTPNGKDSIVTFTASFNTDSPNAIFTNWECSQHGYINNAICPPTTIHYPYACDTTETRAPFLVKFIETETLQKLKPNITDLTSVNGTLPFVNLSDVEIVTNYSLEPGNGFIDKNYHERYINPTTELGIICDLKLKSGAVKHCYILTDYLGTVHWKNPTY